MHIVVRYIYCSIYYLLLVVSIVVVTTHSLAQTWATKINSKQHLRAVTLFLDEEIVKVATKTEERETKNTAERFWRFVIIISFSTKL